MAVMCRQSVDGRSDEIYVIDHGAHPDLDGDDLSLLHRKAQSAEDKGWSVRWEGDDRFVARKVRWENQDVVRECWVA